jgi:hypothetical protein
MVALGSGLGNWSTAYTKAQALVSQMTLVEKVRTTSPNYHGWTDDS